MDHPLSHDIGDPLGQLVGVPAGWFAQEQAPDGTIRFRGRCDDREIHGEYHLDPPRLTYHGRSSVDSSTIGGELAGDGHAAFEAPVRGLLAWLERQR